MLTFLSNQEIDELKVITVSKNYFCELTELIMALKVFIKKACCFEQSLIEFVENMWRLH